MIGKFKVLIFLFFAFLLCTFYLNGPTFAQNCGTTGTAIATGLVSTPTITRNLITSTGACTIDPKAAFAPYKIPSYDDLKSLYYTQAKSSATVTKHDPIGTGGEVYENSIDLTDSTNVANGIHDQLYFINGNLTKRSGQSFPQNAGNLRVGVVLVEGNFTINSDIGYTGGLVFIVKGNVNIDQSVVTINAIIISASTIYTAGANCSSLAPVTSSQLVINGSLISLTNTQDSSLPTPPYTGKPAIQFCRTLANNSAPAELINHQVKYLVILRNLMSDTFQRWSEQ